MADDVLAHLASKQDGRCALDPARVVPRQVALAISASTCRVIREYRGNVALRHSCLPPPSAAIRARGTLGPAGLNEPSIWRSRVPFW